MNREELLQNLPQFIGTENYHKLTLVRDVVFTDGVKFFAENAGGGAYWLMDIIASQPEIRDTARAGFADITLSVDPGFRGTIRVTDGNGHMTYTRDLDYTDCPEGEWKFFYTDGVVMLTSEY